MLKNKYFSKWKYINLCNINLNKLFVPNKISVKNSTHNLKTMLIKHNYTKTIDPTPHNVKIKTMYSCTSFSQSYDLSTEV